MPQFDPTQPFEVLDRPATPRFDPSQPFEEVGAADAQAPAAPAPEIPPLSTEPGRYTAMPTNAWQWTKFMVGGALAPIKQAETAIESTAIAAGLAKPGSRLLWRPSEALEKPVIGNIPQIPKQESLPAQVGAGAVNTVTSFLNFFQTPEGIMSMGLGSLPKLAQKAVLTKFAGDMALSAPEQLQAGIDAAQKGDWQGATQELLAGTGGSILSAKMGEHLTRPEVPVGPRGKNKQQIRFNPIDETRPPVLPQAPLERAQELASQPERTPSEDAELAQLDKFLTKGEQNASEITSPAGVPQLEVRPPVGQETPLRQSGEAAGAPGATDAAAEEKQAADVGTTGVPEQRGAGEPVIDLAAFEQRAAQHLQQTGGVASGVFTDIGIRKALGDLPPEVPLNTLVKIGLIKPTPEGGYEFNDRVQELAAQKPPPKEATAVTKGTEAPTAEPTAPAPEAKPPEGGTPSSEQHNEITALIAGNAAGQAKGAALRRFAEKYGLTVKAAQEMVEAEIVKMAHNAQSSTLTDAEKQLWARLAYARQPTMSARTSTSVENQAYSTPAPLAQALAHAISTRGKTVYEPTAGNGMLMIGSDLAGSHANEIEPGRAAALRKLGVGTVTEKDATKYTPTGKFEKVLANPPFGSMDNQNFGGYGIKRLEHLISLKALDAMADDGQAAIILGAKREPGESGKGAQWVFENYLYGHYNVVGNFEVAGDLYAKQGASWPVRVLVVDGRKVNPAHGDFAPKTVARFSTWDEVWAESNRIRNEIEARRKRVGEQAGVPERASGQPTPAAQPGRIPGRPERPAVPAGGGSEPRGTRGGESEAGKRPADEPATTPPVQPLSRAEDEPVTDTQSGGRRGANAPVETGSGRSPEGKTAPAGGSKTGIAKPEPGSVSGPAAVRGAGNLDGLSEAELDGMLDEATATPAKAASPKRNPTLAPESKAGTEGTPRTQATPTPATRTAADILGDAARAGVKGADEALQGLHDLFGGGKQMLAGVPVFDEETYAKARPHFQSAYESFKESGKSLQEFLKFVVDRFGAAVRPYLKKFIQDTQAIEREPAPPPETKVPQVAATEHQVNYEPRSKGTPFGTLTPRSSAAGVHAALDRLQNRVGPLDDFVANRLHMTPEETRKVMAAEQIDGAALAIDQIEHDGALIIGDETGIGKGRQGAAIIRYGLLNGKIPMFFTKDPKLFTDMYGDLLDIHTEVKPFILGDPGKASIVDSEGNRLHRAPGAAAQRAEMQRILDGGWDKSGYNAIFVTYSQVNVRNVRQHFLERLAQENDALLVMDEAHEAAGDSESSMQAAFMTGGRLMRGSGSDLNIIDVPGLLRAEGTQPGRGGVVYMSATYAKRSDNMPLYFRTALSKASESFAQIVDAMKKGGVALQQAVSEALSGVGQYVRRERDFTGVKFDSKHVAVADEAALIDHVDQVTDVLSEIVDFSHRMAAAVEGATAQSDNATSMTDFASIVHNQVGQLLLAAKADAVVAEAVAAHERGEKPLIALMNTMEAFLTHFADDHGIKPGDPITLRWNELLKHALKRTLRVSEKQPNGDTVIREVNPGDFGLQAAYDAIVKLAEGIESKFPVSPIDYIIQKLAQAEVKADMVTIRGVKIAELTGRESGIEYTDFEKGEGIYRTFKRANKNTIVNSFNDGGHDGMLLNASGSTGLSAHASEKFRDQKPRHMIIAQPALDINVFVQTLGRIKRTGMVLKGMDNGVPYGARYTHLVLPLQAELRPAAMAARKMKSLNANTTAETNSSIKIEAEDLFNRYGDQIAAEYLLENETLQRQLGIPVSVKEDGTVEVPRDVARKFTGRMALRPDAEQKTAYEHILAGYREKIQQLKSTGEYDLEIVQHDDWDGKQLSDTQLAPGTDESNIFTASTRVQRWEIKDNRHVPTGAEMQQEFQRKTGGKGKLEVAWSSSHDEISKAIGDRRTKLEEELQAAKTEAEKAFVQTKLDRFAEMEQRWENTRGRVTDALETAGSVVELHNIETGARYVGTLVEAKLPKGGLSTGPSNFKLRFAVYAPEGLLYLNAGDLVSGKWTVDPSNRRFSELRGMPPGARTERYFVTGNPFRAYDSTGGRGKMVRFGTADGKTVTGLLMPPNWDIGKLRSDPRLELVNGKAAAHFLATYAGRGTPLEAGGTARIMRSRGYGDAEYVLSVPSARRTGGDVYLDQQLRGITGEFTKQGNKMVADLPANRIARAADRVSEILAARWKPVGDAGELIPGVQESNSKNGVAKPSDTAEAVARSLENIKSGRKPGDLNLFGVVPAIWDKAISIAQGIIRAGGKVADAVAAALAHIRANHTGTWDEAKAKSSLTMAMQKEAVAVPTQNMGQMDTVRDRIRMTPESTDASVAHAKKIFDEAGVPVVADKSMGGWRMEQSFESNYEGRKLVELLERELSTPDSPERQNDTLLGSLINSIRFNFKSGAMNDAFDLPIRNELYGLVQGEASRRGMALGALAQHAEDVRFIGHNVDVELTRLYSDAFEGAGLKKFLKAVKKHFGGFFNDATIQGAIDENPDLVAAIEAIRAQNKVEKLVPTVPELIRSIFTTPFYRQEDIVDNFRAALVNGLKADPATAESVAKLFEKAFAQKFAQARREAFEKAKASLTPKELREVVKKPAVLDKLRSAVNAGLFDSASVLQTIAKAHGWPEPKESDIAKIKELSRREQELMDFTPADKEERAAMGETPAEIETARKAKEAQTEGIRAKLRRDMGVLWAGISRPITLRSFTSQQGLRNVRDGLREYIVLNLLTKIGHVTRFPIHLATQVATHFTSRPLAKAWELAQQQGNKMPAWGEIAKAYEQEWQGFKAGLKPAWAGGRAEALGRGEGRNVDGLMDTMNIFGRLDAQAKRYLTQGNYPMYVITRLVGIPEYAGRWISVVDQWQGNPAVYADMLHQADLEMVNAGWTEPERVRFQGELVKAMKTEISQAILETGMTLRASGEPVTPKQIEENAWKLVKFRLQEMMRNAELPADDIAATNEALRRQLAWQDEVRRGIGAPVAKALQTVGKVVPALGAFSNAIGHGLNWTVAKLPPGLHLLADFDFLAKRGESTEPSNFFRTSLDKKQRLIESIGATMGGGLLAGLLMSRMARYNPFITTAQERQEMEREGRKPGTIDFMLPDGKVSTWSLIVGPMTLFAPWIAGFGAASNLARRREGEQEKLNQEAAKRGLKPGKIRDVSATEWAGIAGQAALASILGSKTAGGWTTQFADPSQGLAAKRAIASQIQPFVPGLPGWAEITRMMGVSMSTARASVFDYLVPMPGSQGRAVNVLGDPIGTRDGLSRVIQVLTGGTMPYHGVEKNEDSAYAALINSGYHPPAVAPNKGYAINGEFRPLTNAELAKYTEERGKAFKAALTGLGANASREDVKAAFEGANTAALESVVAEKANVPRGGAQAASGGASGGLASGVSSLGSRTTLRSGFGRGKGLRGIGAIRGVGGLKAVRGIAPRRGLKGNLGGFRRASVVSRRKRALA